MITRIIGRFWIIFFYILFESFEFSIITIPVAFILAIQSSSISVNLFHRLSIETF
jgi:hypothetical protein